MRAHAMIFGIVLFIYVIIGSPGIASASRIFIPQAGFGVLPKIQNLNGKYQTALTAGDTSTYRINVQSFSGIPTVSADFSQIGIDSPTTTPLAPGNNPYHFYLNGVDYFPDYFFSFGPLSVGADIPDGIKTVSVTATDSEGNTATSESQITVDNTAPSISLSDISFSAVPVKKGDTMYLTGSADGTGSPLTIYQIRETLWDAEGNSLWPPLSGINYNDTSVLTSAIADSVDGTFNRVAFTLNDSLKGTLSVAASFKIEITAYDGGGHIVTTSLTVPLPKPPPPDPCIATNTCASNVLFLPGIEGSRLYEGTGCGKAAEEKLWDPVDTYLGILRGRGDDKVRALSLDSTGSSLCSDVYTKEGDIIDSVGGSTIYASLIREMDGLESEGTIEDWKPVAYDWRLSLGDLLTNGSERDGKIFYEEASSTPYIEQTLRFLATSSKTGKVTIIAHSNGGLVAKALLNKLGNTDAEQLVDKVIMVGVPQSGAPQDIGAMLFGYGAGIYQWGTPIVSNSAVREFVQNSPMAYHLLPSEFYLESTMGDAEHPTIRFSGLGYAKEMAAYGNTIANRVALSDFLLAKEGGRTAPAVNNLNNASILNPALIDYANEQHATLDFWSPPAGIEVYQIAGWGVDTVGGIDFYTLPPVSVLGALEPVRAYRPILIEDGDGTVPVPSALMMASSENVKRYWLNLDSYRIATSERHSHADLFELSPLQDFIEKILKNSTSTIPAYISSSHPTSTNRKRLIFFLHSPLTLQLTDSGGNITGLALDGSVTQDIPGSTYSEFGDVKYVSVPQGNTYQLSMHGQESGSFSLDIQESSGGIVTASTTIAGVPVTANTLASLTITDGIDTASALTVEENGNGDNAIIITPRSGEIVNYELPGQAVEPTNVVSHGGGGGGASIVPPQAEVVAPAAGSIATTTQEILPEATTTMVIASSTEVITVKKPFVPAAVKIHRIEKAADSLVKKANTFQTASVYEASQQPIIKKLRMAVYNKIYKFWSALKKLFN